MRALVTGASEGIGAALARELAARGHDLVIVARNVDRLEALARALPAVDVEILAADLQVPDELAVAEKRVSSPEQPIDLLVNNAGFTVAGRFDEIDRSAVAGQIDLNVTALVRLSHAALQAMVPRRSGAILNVGSFGGFHPAPQAATYSATKAFVLSFSQSLHEELAPLGVSVTCLCPGFTPSAFQERAGIDPAKFPKLLWNDVADVARAGLDALERNEAICVPGLAYKVMAGLIDVLPRGLVRKAAAKATKRF